MIATSVTNYEKKRIYLLLIVTRQSQIADFARRVQPTMCTCYIFIVQQNLDGTDELVSSVTLLLLRHIHDTP